MTQDRPQAPVTEERLDELLSSVRSHAPLRDVEADTLAWIGGDLEAMGGWVPPIRGDRMEADDVVSEEAAVAAFSMRARAPMPLIASGCLILFMVSTAVAVTETKLPEGDELSFGEIATLETVFDTRRDRFATLLIAPEAPSDRSQRLFAKLRRTIDDTPAGHRTIGDQHSRQRARLLSTAQLGDVIASLNAASPVGHIAEVVAHSLDDSRAVSTTPSSRTLPPQALERSREVVFGGKLANDDKEFALGEVLSPRAERAPELDLDSAQRLVSERSALPNEVVRQVVERHRAALRQCYETELQRASGLRSRVELRWVIAADGTVRSSQVVHAAPRWPALETCLTAEVSSWVFPKPRGGSTVEVNYPVLFRPALR